MGKSESALQSGAVPRKGKKYFTLADARRALPLVKRIAADIQSTQSDRLRLHAELSAQTVQESPTPRIRALQEELDKQTNRLEHLAEELHKIGVDLKDPSRG